MWKVLEDLGEIYTCLEDTREVHTCVVECERLWNVGE